MNQLFAIALVFISLQVSAQIPEKDAIMETVNNVFIAMKTNDSTLAKSSFTADAILHTVVLNDQEQYEKRSHPAQRLITAFGKPKAQTWSEPIWNEKIEIDGGLAQVWVNYAFFIDKEFSHCGVDAFHLINTSTGWKIFHLVDTRQKTNCKLPDGVKEAYR